LQKTKKSPRLYSTSRMMGLDVHHVKSEQSKALHGT
jgi:hypothetical protein